MASLFCNSPHDIVFSWLCFTCFYSFYILHNFHPPSEVFTFECQKKIKLVWSIIMALPCYGQLPGLKLIIVFRNWNSISRQLLPIYALYESIHAVVVFHFICIDICLFVSANNKLIIHDLIYRGYYLHVFPFCTQTAHIQIIPQIF